MIWAKLTLQPLIDGRGAGKFVPQEPYSDSTAAASEAEAMKRKTDKEAQNCDHGLLKSAASLELKSRAIAISEGGVLEIINKLREEANDACKCREGLALPKDYGPTTIILAIHGSEDGQVGTPGGRVDRAVLMGEIAKLKSEFQGKDCITFHVTSCFQTEGNRESFYVRHAHNQSTNFGNVPTNNLRPASVTKIKIPAK